MMRYYINEPSIYNDSGRLASYDMMRYYIIIRGMIVKVALVSNGTSHNSNTVIRNNMRILIIIVIPQRIGWYLFLLLPLPAFLVLRVLVICHLALNSLLGLLPGRKRQIQGMWQWLTTANCFLPLIGVILILRLQRKP
jgi:hypothetical protein